MCVDLRMDQLSLWTNEPAPVQVQIPDTIKQDLLRKMAQLLLEVVVEHSLEKESTIENE
jgi:hypothetical protein